MTNNKKILIGLLVTFVSITSVHTYFNKIFQHGNEDSSEENNDYFSFGRNSYSKSKRDYKKGFVNPNILNELKYQVSSDSETADRSSEIFNSNDLYDDTHFKQEQDDKDLDQGRQYSETYDDNNSEHYNDNITVRKVKTSYETLIFLKNHLQKTVEHLIRVFTYKIHHGRSIEVANDIDHLAAEALLPAIIVDAYINDVFQLNETIIQDNIIEFLTHLDEIFHIRTGFNEFMKMLRMSESKLISSKICLLLRRMRGPLEGIDIGNMTLKAVKEFGKRIKNVIFKMNFTCEEPNNLGEVQMIYDGNLNNFKGTLILIRARKDKQQLVEGLLDLLKEMKHLKHTNTREFLELLHVIRQNTNPAALEKIQYLIPSSTKDLIWKADSTNVWLKNKANSEYLHRSSNDLILPTVRTSALNQTDAFTNWLLFPSRTGKSFYIQNGRSMDYLCLHASTDNQVVLFLNKSLSHCEWKITPVENGKFIKIQSKVNHKYLYASNGQNLMLSDIQKESLNQDKILWKFELKTDKDRIKSLLNINQGNVDIALQYVSSLDPDKVPAETIALLGQIKKNRKIDSAGTIQTAYFLKTKVRSGDLILPAGFPSIIRDLIWKGSDTNTWIRNIRYNEYLYPELTDENKNNFTDVRLGHPDVMDSYASWLLIPNFFGRSFRIHNQNLGLDLCTISRNKVKNVLRLLRKKGTKENKKCSWKITPASNGTYIQIESLTSGLTLNIQPIGSKNEVNTVNLTLISNEDLNQTYWTLESYHDIERVFIILKNDYENLDKALLFLKSIKLSRDMVEAGIALHDKMKTDELADRIEYIKFALFAKQVIGRNDSEGLLKRKFPEVIQDVVWGSENYNAWILNKFSQEYLVATENPNSNELTVFTEALGNIKPIGNWNLTSQYPNATFFIKNALLNKDLVLVKEEKLTTQGATNWTILGVNDNYYVKIIYSNGDLLCVEDNKNETKVTIISPQTLSEQTLDKCLWSVICKNQTKRTQLIYNGTEDNLNKTLLYIKSLSHLNDSVQAATALVGAMIAHEHVDTPGFIQVAQHFKKSINDSQSQSVVKDSFPELVQQLIWTSDNDNTWLSNVGAGEYLFTSSTNDSTSKNLTTASKNKMNSHGNWQLIELNDAKEFRIFNSRFKQDLCVQNLIKNEVLEFKNSSTELNDSCLWTILPTEQGKFMQIQNKLTKKILYIKSDPEGGSEKISMLKPEALNSENRRFTFWKIDSKNNTERVKQLYDPTVGDMEQALNYVDSFLPEYQEEATKGINSIIHHLNSNQQFENPGLIQVAYFVKTKIINDSLVKIWKADFPLSVQELVWNSFQVNSWIQNVATNEYLSVDHEIHTGNVITKSINLADSYANWLLLPQNSAKTFRIYNSRLNEDLCVKTDFLTDKSGTNFNHLVQVETQDFPNGENTSVPDRCQWIIFPADNRKSFKFKSKVIEAFLNTPSSMSPANVLLEGSKYNLSLWTISSKNNHDRIMTLYNETAELFMRPINFIGSLKNVTEKVDGIKTLHNEMKRMKHTKTYGIVWLADLIRNVLEKDQNQVLLKLVATEFPLSIKELIFRGHNVSCWIKSKSFNEYMYVAGMRDATKRTAFLWMPGDMGVDGDMIIKPNKSVMAFEVQNKKYKAEMYSSVDQNNMNDKNGVYFTLEACDDNCFWEILPTEQPNYVYIRTKTNHSYLYADESYFEGSRNIYTSTRTIQNLTDNDRTLWELQCRSTFERIKFIYNQDVKNVKKALTFIRSLTSNKDIKIAFNALIDEMIQLGHHDSFEFVNLAIAIKKGITKNGWDPSIKNIFPSMIQNIVWPEPHVKCQFQNVFSGKKLTVDSRIVLFEDKNSDAANWILDFNDVLKTIQIKNSQKQEYLSHNNTVLTTRPVCENIEDDVCRWKLASANGAKYIQILSKSGNRLVFGDSSNQIISINNMQEPNLNKEKSLWSLDCKKDEDRIVELYNHTLANFPLTLDYIKSLQEKDEICDSIKAFIKEMTKNKHSSTKEMIQLGYFALQKINEGVDEKLQNEFPKMVQNLIWGNPTISCWIKNDLSNKYLCVSSNKAKELELVPYDSVNSFGNWMLVLRDAGNYFYIQNTRVTEYLMKFNQNSLKTLKTDNFGQPFEWEVTPVDENKIQIREHHGKRYLMVKVSSSSTVSAVLQTVPTNQNHLTGNIWSLDCRNDSDRIQSVFNRNLTNLNHLLNYIKSLPDKEQIFESISTTLNYMKNNQLLDSKELILLALLTKDMMNKHGVKVQLRDQFPILIKNLIWTEPEIKCWLQNREINKYLYVSDGKVVYAVEKEEMNAKGNWIAEPNNMNGNFQIKNSRFMSVLAAENHDISATDLLSCNKSDCFWKIEPINNAKHMLIRNWNSKELLVLHENTEGNYSLELVSSDDSTVNKNSSHWTIECKTNEERIRHLYSQNLSNFEKTLSFIKELHINHEILNATLLLFDLMKSNNQIDTNEFIQLAYFSKTQGYQNETDFPDIIKDLIWKGDTHKCRLRNKIGNAFLYGGYYEHDQRRRYVFTWVPGDIDSRCEWNFEPKDNAKEFGIKNTHFNEYLGAFSGKKEDEFYRATFTWTPGDYDNQCEWVITPTKNATWFHIRHKNLKDYLYADHSRGTERRKIFAWPAENVAMVKDRVLWKLKCSELK